MLTPTEIYLKHSGNRLKIKKAQEEKDSINIASSYKEIVEHVNSELCFLIENAPYNDAWFVRIPRKLYAQTWKTNQEACNYLEDNLLPPEDFEIEHVIIREITFDKMPYSSIQVKIKPSKDLLAYENTVTNQ